MNLSKKTRRKCHVPVQWSKLKTRSNLVYWEQYFDDLACHASSVIIFEFRQYGKNALRPRSESFRFYRFYRFYSRDSDLPGENRVGFSSDAFDDCGALGCGYEIKVESFLSIPWKRNDAMQSGTLTKSIRNGTAVFRNSRRKKEKKKKKDSRKEKEELFILLGEEGDRKNFLHFPRLNLIEVSGWGCWGGRGWSREQFWWLRNFQFIPFAEFLRRAVRDKRIRDTHSWIEMEVGLAL